MLQNFPLCKKMEQKSPFFLSRNPTYHSFTFKLWFLYELNHKVRLFKTVCGIFHFRFCFRFIKSLYFCSTICMDSLILKRHNSFQNLENGKATHRFAPRPLIFKLQHKIQWYLRELELPKNWPWGKCFKLRKSKSWERHCMFLSCHVHVLEWIHTL